MVRFDYQCKNRKGFFQLALLAHCNKRIPYSHSVCSLFSMWFWHAAIPSTLDCIYLLSLLCWISSLCVTPNMFPHEFLSNLVPFSISFMTIFNLHHMNIWLLPSAITWIIVRWELWMYIWMAQFCGGDLLMILFYVQPHSCWLQLYCSLHWDESHSLFCKMIELNILSFWHWALLFLLLLLLPFWKYSYNLLWYEFSLPTIQNYPKFQ